MQTCSNTVFRHFFGKNGSCFIDDSEATIQSKYIIFWQIKLYITGFKMMPESNSCVSLILSYSRLKMMKTMRASKKAVKPMLFYKTLYFLKFYYCVNEIRTAYNFISCHYMYGISDKSNDIYNYLFKGEMRQIILAHPVCHVCFRHMHHIW